MNTLSYKTTSINKQTANREWVLVDAKDQTLGRMCSEIAKIIRGKHKPTYTPHSECGDRVVVVNCRHIKLTGNKMTQRQYIRHTGYPGGQRFTTPAELLQKQPEEVVRRAVRGMLPKNKLGRALLKNLYLFSDEEHDKDAQKPKQINLQ